MVENAKTFPTSWRKRDADCTDYSERSATPAAAATKNRRGSSELSSEDGVLLSAVNCTSSGASSPQTSRTASTVTEDGTATGVGKAVSTRKLNLEDYRRHRTMDQSSLSVAREGNGKQEETGDTAQSKFPREIPRSFSGVSGVGRSRAKSPKVEFSGCGEEINNNSEETGDGGLFPVRSENPRDSTEFPRFCLNAASIGKSGPKPDSTTGMGSETRFGKSSCGPPGWTESVCNGGSGAEEYSDDVPKVSGNGSADSNRGGGVDFLSAVESCSFVTSGSSDGDLEPPCKRSRLSAEQQDGSFCRWIHHD